MYDLVVVGGGINGVGIAADAAGRGLKVALFEQDDLASATSSASSKLVHGGLRYLEQYEFRLVREALQERETLMNMAPHLITPMRFRLPHESHLRPAWMIRAGLFLYDHLADRDQLPGCKMVRFGSSSVLQPQYKIGFEYSDCWVDDARLVVLNAVMAKEQGADIQPRHRVVNARREHSHWRLIVRSESGDHEVLAKALVNAAGPWVQQFIEQGIQQTSPHQVRLVQGSHIIVPKLHDQDESYILQNTDGRIVFVIPYLDEFSMIGTTDQEFKGNPAEAEITEEEARYLVDVSNRHFVQQISLDDILHTFSGVRPLLQDEADDPSKVTRDYTLQMSEASEGAPLLNVFGGKLTTYRKLAEAALAKLKVEFPEMGDVWTARSLLPGGDFPMSLDEYRTQLSHRRPGIEAHLYHRWAAQYGSRIEQLLDGRTEMEQLGEKFSPDLYQVEVDYLVANEWAMTCDDILWRRTKLGYKLSQSEVDHLAAYLDGERSESLDDTPSQVNGSNG